MPSPVVSLTGGATGIGAAVVDQLREQDATVYVLDVADAPERDGVHTIHCDLADRRVDRRRGRPVARQH